MNDLNVQAVQNEEDDSIESLFGTDPQLEQEGVWCQYGTMRFLLARAGGANRRYGKVMMARMKPVRRALEIGNLSEERSRALLADVLAETVVLNWEKVKYKKQVLEYSKENCRNLLTEFPDLLNELHSLAQRLELYRKDSSEAAAKNS